MIKYVSQISLGVSGFVLFEFLTYLMRVNEDIRRLGFIIIALAVVLILAVGIFNSIGLSLQTQSSQFKLGMTPAIILLLFLSISIIAGFMI